MLRPSQAGLHMQILSLVGADLHSEAGRLSWAAGATRTTAKAPTVATVRAVVSGDGRAASWRGRLFGPAVARLLWPSRAWPAGPPVCQDLSPYITLSVLLIARLVLVRGPLMRRLGGLGGLGGAQTNILPPRTCFNGRAPLVPQISVLVSASTTTATAATGSRKS